MRQSEQVLEWMAEGEARGEARGEVMGMAKGWAASLIEILKMRFGPLPAELVSAINAETDASRLKEWFLPAVSASSLTDFRQLVQL